MKLMYGGTPVKSLNINYFEQDTNDCDMVASDLQAGKTAVARGKKITGTGKCFEFADYGGIYTNFPVDIPSAINVIEIASTAYPVKTTIELSNMKSIDFTVSQNIGSVIIDSVEYPVTLIIEDNLLELSCEKRIRLQTFYGKDNYI